MAFSLRLGYLRLNYRIFMYSTLVLFLTSTVLLSRYLNRIQPYYFIDEAFHVPQTLRYCAGNFTQWDPKITTLPGLYLIASTILSPFDGCNITSLRFINLLGTCLNLYLVYNIIKNRCKSSETDRWNNWLMLTLAYNVTLFPPLFFWCFFYYTDVVSVNVVLSMFLAHQHKQTRMAAFAGFLAVLVRQTNIIWLGYFAIEHALDIFDRGMAQSASPRVLNTPMHFLFIWKQVMCEARKGPSSFTKFIARLCSDLLPYITVCLLFVAFVVLNEGVVIGDRTAHVATIHVCQILYFSAFVSLFSWPYVVPHWRACLHLARRYWLLASFVVALMIAAIRLNTLVHPYVLADNRHYWFYVWNRFMGRYAAFRYLLIPVYCASLLAISRNIAHLRFLTQMNYGICVCAVLIPQLLVEPRYFILPYIFYRLSMKRPYKWQIYFESLTTLTINFAQFFIFVNKTFYWQDQPYVQRISW